MKNEGFYSNPEMTGFKAMKERESQRKAILNTQKWLVEALGKLVLSAAMGNVGRKITKDPSSPPPTLPQSPVKTRRLVEAMKNRKKIAKFLDADETRLFGAPDSREDYERQNVGF